MIVDVHTHAPRHKTPPPVSESKLSGLWRPDQSASTAHTWDDYIKGVEPVDRAIVFNAVMFAVASAAAQAVLRRLYRPLIARDPRHRRLLRAWVIVYAFVGIQMGWVLRPFIGDPSKPTQFFRDGAWGNAYVEVAKQAWRAAGGARPSHTSPAQR